MRMLVIIIPPFQLLLLKPAESSTCIQEQDMSNNRALLRFPIMKNLRGNVLGARGREMKAYHVNNKYTL